MQNPHIHHREWNRNRASCFPSSGRGIAANTQNPAWKKKILFPSPSVRIATEFLLLTDQYKRWNPRAESRNSPAMGIPASLLFLVAQTEAQPPLLGVVPSDALHHHPPTWEQLVYFLITSTENAQAQQQCDWFKNKTQSHQKIRWTLLPPNHNNLRSIFLGKGRSAASQREELWGRKRAEPAQDKEHKRNPTGGRPPPPPPGAPQSNHRQRGREGAAPAGSALPTPERGGGRTPRRRQTPLGTGASPFRLPAGRPHLRCGVGRGACPPAETPTGPAPAAAAPGNGSRRDGSGGGRAEQAGGGRPTAAGPPAAGVARLAVGREGRSRRKGGEARGCPAAAARARQAGGDRRGRRRAGATPPPALARPRAAPLPPLRRCRCSPYTRRRALTHPPATAPSLRSPGRRRPSLTRRSTDPTSRPAPPPNPHWHFLPPVAEERARHRATPTLLCTNRN